MRRSIAVNNHGVTNIERGILCHGDGTQLNLELIQRAGIRLNLASLQLYIYSLNVLMRSLLKNASSRTSSGLKGDVFRE